MLIEDDDRHAELFRLAWNEARVPDRLDVVSSGDEALSVLATTLSRSPALPQLILLDLNMPGRDGREVLVALRADHRLDTVPIVILTTSASPYDRTHTAALGADGYVVKPFRYAQLVEEIRSIATRWLRFEHDHGEGAATTGAPTRTMRVLIVDDHAMLIEAIKLSLVHATIDRIDVVLAPDPTEAAVRELARVLAPDLVLVDLDLGPTNGGYALINPLVLDGHRVVLFTGATDAVVLGDALAAGAIAVLRKTEPFHRLVEGICDAANGRSVTAPAVRDELVAHAHASRARDQNRADRLAHLSSRERTVLERLAQGASPAQIAATNFVSIATVRSQIRSILIKLDVTSQLAAVAISRTADRPH